VHEDPHVLRGDPQPRGDLLVGVGGAGDLVRHQVALVLAHLDDVVLANPVGRDVDLAAVDQEVTVPHLLAGGVARLGEAGAVDHVVEPALQDLEQVLAGLAGPPAGLLVVAVELLLEDAVDAAGLLLLPELELVLRLLGTATAVLTRRVGTDLDGALRGLALLALEEELGLLPAAELAVRTRVTSHFSSLLSSDSAALRRTAAVVRDRGHVLDRVDLETGRLQGADRGLTAGAGPLDEDVDLPHAVLHGTAGGVLGGHLRRERRGLARALEPDVAGAGPGDHVPVG